MLKRDRADEIYMFCIFFIMTVIYVCFFLGCMGCSQTAPAPTVVMPTVEPLIGGASSECPFGGAAITYNNHIIVICNGAPGANGIDLTPITVIQLCPGTTSTYPTDFPEVAFCIANKLYAVYSAHDGFLTEVPPGLYESNAVGSKCTFTILPNCVVQ